MSQIPPGQSDGWYDPYGTYQPGLPPPGYWQANDGRWYPPNPPTPTPPAPAAPVNPAAAETQIAHPQHFAAPQPAAPQPPAPQPAAPQPVGPPPSFAPPAGPPPAGPPPSSPPPGPLAPSPFEPPQASVAQPGHYAPPPNFAPPQGVKKSRTGLFVALAVVSALVIFGGGAALLALGESDDDPTPTTAAEATGASTTTVSAGGDEPTSETTVGSTATTAAAPAGNGAVADVVGCTIIDEDTMKLEVVNGSSSIQSYFLTVAFFEGDERLGDTIAFINNLRPGERTIEDSFIFDQPGSRCEVIESETFSFESDPAHLADVSPCEITGVDFFDDVAAELSATNSTSSNADYNIEVALVGADGVRRGTGFATVEAVSPGQTAPSDVFTSVDEEDGLICDVVSVTRTNP